jgi:hypothetical protein
MHTKTYSVVPDSVRAVHVASVQAVTLNRGKLRWDPRKSSKQDDLQLLLNRQGRSILGVLPTTTQGALMRESGLTSVPVTLDSRYQLFAAKIENICCSKLNELHCNPSSGALISKAARLAHEDGRTTKGMNCLALGKEHGLRFTPLNDTAAAKRATQRWARESEAKNGAGVWRLWTDGWRSDNHRMGAAAVCKHEDEWRSHGR